MMEDIEERYRINALIGKWKLITISSNKQRFPSMVVNHIGTHHLCRNGVLKDIAEYSYSTSHIKDRCIFFEKMVETVDMFAIKPLSGIFLAKVLTRMLVNRKKLP